MMAGALSAPLNRRRRGRRVQLRSLLRLKSRHQTLNPSQNQSLKMSDGEHPLERKTRKARRARLSSRRSKLNRPRNPIQNPNLNHQLTISAGELPLLERKTRRVRRAKLLSKRFRKSKRKPPSPRRNPKRLPTILAGEPL